MGLVKGCLLLEWGLGLGLSLVGTYILSLIEETLLHVQL